MTDHRRAPTSSRTPTPGRLGELSTPPPALGRVHALLEQLHDARPLACVDLGGKRVIGVSRIRLARSGSSCGCRCRLVGLVAALCLAALVLSGCTGSSPGPVDMTRIDFEDYPERCGSTPTQDALSDCYQQEGVSIDGAHILDTSGPDGKDVEVNGERAIESCALGTGTCTGRISIAFTMAQVHVRMRVGHSEALSILTRTGSCESGRIVLTAYAGTSEVGSGSVQVEPDECVPDVRYMRLPRTPGLDGSVQVRSATGAITRVEVGWSNPSWTVPIIVDDLEFQLALSELTVNPDPAMFSLATDSGGAVTATVSISNTGTIPLGIDTLSIAGADSEDFSIDGDCAGRTLEPGASCPVVVTFSASGDGSRRATLTVLATTGVTYTAQLVGRLPPPQATTTSGVPTTMPTESFGQQASRWPPTALLAAIAAVAASIGLVAALAVRSARNAARRTPHAAVPAGLWVEPGPTTDTIRMNGPDIAVVVVLDPAAGSVNWTEGTHRDGHR